jgi:hypothetical protein
MRTRKLVPGGVYVVNEKPRRRWMMMAMAIHHPVPEHRAEFFAFMQRRWPRVLGD